MADVAHSLWMVVLAVIGVVITLFVLQISTPFLNLAAVEKSEQGTRVVYALVIDQVRQLEAGQKLEGIVPNAAVQSDMLLTGFGPSDNLLEDKCQNKPLLRPLNRCPLGKACLCLCIAGRGCDDTELPSCTVLDRTKSFTLQGIPDANALGADVENGKQLLMYGKCGTFSSTLKPTTLYLYYDDDAATHLVVATEPPATGVAKLAKQTPPVVTAQETKQGTPTGQPVAPAPTVATSTGKPGASASSSGKTPPA
jgi:hypothetical protein